MPYKFRSVHAYHESSDEDDTEDFSQVTNLTVHVKANKFIYTCWNNKFEKEVVNSV